MKRTAKVRIRDYAGPLGVLAAGMLGMGLLWSVSAMAMKDLSGPSLVTVEPLNLIDLAISNLDTAAALTEQAVTAFVPTSTSTSTLITFTVVPSDISTFTPTYLPTNTLTVSASVTPIGPTRTRRPKPDGPLQPTTAPSAKTPIPPTTTLVPSPTNTLILPTDTPFPLPTETLPPPPTETPIPPPTNTPISPPTDTVAPVIPTNTSAPPANATMPLEVPVDATSVP